MNKVIAGDIGGTKTRLALVEVVGTHVRVEREAGYPSRDFATFESLLAEFLKDIKAPAHAAFGIAGPVVGGAVRTTNLPWYIEADVLRQRFGFKKCASTQRSGGDGLRASRFGRWRSVDYCSRVNRMRVVMPPSSPPEPGWVKRECIGMENGIIPMPPKADTPASVRRRNWSLLCWITCNRVMRMSAGNAWFPAWGWSICTISCEAIAKLPCRNGWWMRCGRTMRPRLFRVLRSGGNDDIVSRRWIFLCNCTGAEAAIGVEDDGRRAVRGRRNRAENLPLLSATFS